MIYRNSITQDRLKQVLYYDPETGIFTWLVRPTNSVQIGDVAGSLTRKGYRQIMIDGVTYLAHRLAWLYATGTFPVDGMDHINGNPADNRIVNLREATGSENDQNRKSRRNSASKFVGVCWSKDCKKWEARICVNSKQRYLGQFATEEEAYVAYCAAKKSLHTFNPVPRNDRIKDVQFIYNIKERL